MQDIVFRGIAAPLRLNGAEAVLPHLPGIMVGWPFQCDAVVPSTQPFFSISAEPGEALLRCENHGEDKPPRRFDPVNALCDVVAALAMALPAEDPSLICLHAAGVAMAGRLVVFPNVQRAGKSTLSVALARAGHALFSDDVVPLSFTADTRAHGHAMGIAPRLRLPLPATIDRDFRDWVEAAAGPRNQQYHYLSLTEQPAHGTMLPVGAFVILDRQDDPGPARLDPVTPDIAMDALLHQNFTRDRHSADILQAMAATLSNQPVFRLSYSGLADAVACLEAAFAQWPDPDPIAAPGPAVTFRSAEFDHLARGTRSAGAPLGQRRGTVAHSIGDRLYLADAKGRAIHRMDPLAAAIWAVLEVPTSSQGIEALLADAFPEVSRDQIAADLGRLLADFDRAGLIEAQSIG